VRQLATIRARISIAAICAVHFSDFAKGRRTKSSLAPSFFLSTEHSSRVKRRSPPPESCVASFSTRDLAMLQICAAESRGKDRRSASTEMNSPLRTGPSLWLTIGDS
jgi:hypothetical protein